MQVTDEASEWLKKQQHLQKLQIEGQFRESSCESVERFFLSLPDSLGELELYLSPYESYLHSEANASSYDNKLDVIASVLAHNQTLRKLVVKVPPLFNNFIFFYS